MIKRLIIVARPARRPGPSLTEIAASLGVSAATVSNALSRKGRVSSDVAEKIRRRAAALGYVPSPAARALRTGRTGVLGLVLPDIANPLFPQIAQAIEAAASGVGRGVLIADSRGSVSAQTEAIERLLERGVDGMIIVPRRGTRVADVGCPLAVIDTPSTPGNTVSADHWGGGRQIGQHLAALGHEKILLIGTDPASNVQNDRIGGIKSGLGTDTKSQTLWTERLEAQKGAGCSLGLVERAAEGFTAFAALSDLHALRALTELQRAGIGVPEDVSVTGFDDLVWSSVVTPTLTTVRMDVARIAEIAIAALVDAIDGGKIGASPGSRAATVKAAAPSVPMKLIVRQSSGRAPTSSRNLKQGALAQ
jgi:LacI family transcriptional regulator, galactose operon repressor